MFHDPHKARPLTLLRARERMGAGHCELLAALWDPTCPLHALPPNRNVRRPDLPPPLPAIRYLHVPACTCTYLRY